MAEILTDMESAETFKAYESYLLGRPAEAGTVLRQGAFFYIWKEKKNLRRTAPFCKLLTEQW